MEVVLAYDLPTTRKKNKNVYLAVSKKVHRLIEKLKKGGRVERIQDSLLACEDLNVAEYIASLVESAGGHCLIMLVSKIREYGVRKNV